MADDIRMPTKEEWIKFLTNVPTEILLNAIQRRAKRAGMSTDEIIEDTRKQIQAADRELDELEKMNVEN